MVCTVVLSALMAAITWVAPRTRPVIVDSKSQSIETHLSTLPEDPPDLALLRGPVAAEGRCSVWQLTGALMDRYDRTGARQHPRDRILFG